jgi:uncharacterized protein YcgL (UPF0745 family)
MSKILCNIYKSGIKDEMYLYVHKVDELKKVPEQLLSLFGKPIFVTTMFISADKKLARANVVDVLQSMIDKGFYLQMPPPPTMEMKELAEKNSKLARR